MNVCVCAVMLIPSVLISSGLAAQESVAPARKEAGAVRVPNGAIRIDGHLDEEVWRSAAPVTDFVQREPVQGAPPFESTDVRFVYDDGGLYVGARMQATAPIQAPLGRRDEDDQAEHLNISLDTYLDRRTAVTFGVTASGVRIDFYHPADNGDAEDLTFNPVWQAQTSIDADGWTAELWIPFAQLRFNERDPQVWGLNIRRWVPSRNEEIFWSPVSRTDQRWASLFGNLTGISGIRPRHRLEFVPYLASDSHVDGDRDASDPFRNAFDLNGRVGADLKVGLGSDLTLEATVNPDFGQVEADPALINLSAFEVFFDERRPFFVEGARLLTGNVENYFYSRRIGAAPDVEVDGDFVDYPARSTILGAAKLTGRLRSGTSIGVLGAVTGEESARVAARGNPFEAIRVAPRTTYGVARLQQEFGAGGSTVAVMATAVHRSLGPSDRLALQLPHDAVSVSGDSVLRFGDYELQSDLGITRVAGSAAAIARLQQSSARYFQRPDADYLTFDPARTAISGARGGFAFERQNARHWVVEFEGGFRSPEFETNDIGRLNRADTLALSGEVEYQETTPGRWYREYAISIGTEREWNFGGESQRSRVVNDLDLTWLNFWRTSLETEYDLRRQDSRLTRGGPSMQRPAGWIATLTVHSNEASRTRGDIVVAYGRTEDGGLRHSTEVTVGIRPEPRWHLSVTPRYEREVDTQQYIDTLSGGMPATFGYRYVFGHIDRSTYSAQTRFNFTFKPDLNLDLYAEPFAASGKYGRIGELLAARSREMATLDPTTLDSDETLDFNVRSFRSNVVLRWEWRPGSTLFVVWQQDRAADRPYRNRASLGDLFGSFGAAGDNFFAVKASFWLAM